MKATKLPATSVGPTDERSREEQDNCSLTDSYEAKVDDHWKTIASV
jgi:hypothetical protein